ncbi:MAG TPA: VOC family protein [Acidimicrobiia bacterium]|nr:VOC family protein [Acidimicrobiia bacterium]
MPRITPNLWFDTNALGAAEFYVSVFPNSEVTDVTYYPDDAPNPGGILTVSFLLDGQEHTAINGGPQFTFDEAVSLLINCADQDDVDYYWSALTADGGEESQCGWLKDKFGLSWQVVPEGWAKLYTSDDKEAVKRALNAMYGMQKLDLGALQDAFDGKTTSERRT